MKSFISLFRHFIIALIVAIAVGIYLWTNQPPKPPSPPVALTPPLPSPHTLKNAAKSLPVPTPTQAGTDDIYALSSASPNPPTVPSPSTQTEIPTHLFYSENAQNLVEVGTYYERKAYLDREAAEAFKQMKLAAQQNGVELMPISGFRSVTDQKKLFERQIQRQGSPKAAARLSAPPGFSEHHTGYALDIGDGKSTETDLKLAFESTKAYRWLKDNAEQYGFELSFPQNNAQGVSYEPWHWRFVGSPAAQAIFRAASSTVQP